MEYKNLGQNCNSIINVFHFIGYTPNWGEWKIEGMSGIGWNGFHHSSFHSIPFVQNQTMECGTIPLHSIPFHHSPPIHKNDEIDIIHSTIVINKRILINDSIVHSTIKINTINCF